MRPAGLRSRQSARSPPFSQPCGACSEALRDVLTPEFFNMHDLAPAFATPRPAHVAPEAVYAYQRRFGSDLHEAHRGTSSVDRRMDEEFGPPMGQATVYRDGKQDHAELQIDIGGMSEVRLNLKLDASGLRDLAHRLLDAAHDLATNPAAALARLYDLPERITA